MPLLLKRSVSDSIGLGVWHTSETEEELYSIAGSRFEEDTRIQESSSRIRLQRLAVRALLKELNGQTKLDYLSTGKPVLSGSAVDVSISHTDELVAVMTSNRVRAGIDLEVIGPKVLRIQDKFISSLENAGMAIPIDSEHLLVYWCAKEALYKMNGQNALNFKEDMYIYPFQYSPSGGRIKATLVKDMNTQFELCYEKVKNHILVYVLNS
jgi:4'-phosphopantetheinyl transferase